MNQRKPHPLGILHRYGGITSAVAVIVICATGLLLNHTDELRLSETTIATPWLLNWYGIAVPAAQSYTDQQQVATQIGAQIWVNDEPIGASTHPLAGIMLLDGQLIVATTQEVFLLTKKLELIEQIDSGYGLPTPIEALGHTLEGRLVIQTPTGKWTGTSDLSNWTNDTSVTTEWSKPHLLTADELEPLQRLYRGPGLSLERVVLDIHSGRGFGKAGRWIADAAAILFILLAMTGIWMWFKTRRRKA